MNENRLLINNVGIANEVPYYLSEMEDDWVSLFSSFFVDF